MFLAAMYDTYLSSDFDGGFIFDMNNSSYPETKFGIVLNGESKNCILCCFPYCYMEKAL